MDHYQDLKILPDPEFSPPMLLNALFAKLHRQLAAQQSTQVGISFPKIDPQRPTLGKVLRLHGTHQALSNLHQQSWIKGMRDHLEMGEISPIPENVQHCQIRRVQAKSNAARLRRRYQKRHEGVTEADAQKLIPDSVEKRLNLPFLQLKSESTNQRFCLFIEQRPAQEHAQQGEFNSYGLSRDATVPVF